MNRIGFGTDIHRLEPGRPMVIGGIVIPSAFGPAGHSDGDILLHAVTDALLGAVAAGDIGSHFPDTDERWRGADSTRFVLEALSLTRERGYRIANVDATIDLESPKLRPFIDAIRARVAELLAVDVDCVSVKAKTGEGLGPVGSGSAISATAAVLLERRS